VFNRSWVVLLPGFFFAVSAGRSWAQSAVTLHFSVTWGNEAVSNKKAFANESGSQNYRFTKIKQYVSGITLYKSGTEVWRDSSYHLIDFFDDKSSSVFLKNTPSDFDELRFLTGIDSAMQTRGVQGGALDPLNGMYWSWQSGYIHTKIEASMIGVGEEETLELHLGGYRYPSNTNQNIAVECGDKQHVQLVLDLKPIVRLCEEKHGYKVMSPGNKAVELAKVWARSIAEKP